MAKQPTPSKTGGARASASLGAFDRANPKIFDRLQGDAASIRHVGNLQSRVNRIKTRLREHYKKYEEPWVAKEGIRIWQKQLKAAQGRNPVPVDPPAAIMLEARRNVRARVARRMTNINEIRTRMENAFLRNRASAQPANEIGPAQSLKPSLKRKL